MTNDNPLAGADEEQSIESDEEEDLSDEDVVYQINTFGAHLTVDGLVNRLDRGDIFCPDFQRNYYMDGAPGVQIYRVYSSWSADAEHFSVSGRRHPKAPYRGWVATPHHFTGFP